MPDRESNNSDAKYFMGFQGEAMDSHGTSNPQKGAPSKVRLGGVSYAPVDGSIFPPISVILLAGNPLSSA